MKKTPATKKDCSTSTCLECALCRAINYEEKRVAPLQLKNEIKALYGAEASSYYFYFSPLIKSSQTMSTSRQLV